MNRSSAPPLYGLVLAGGTSRRMGIDKGTLDYHGCPQVVHMARLLQRCCGRVVVSINPRQEGIHPYSTLPTVVDRSPFGGPAAGLLAAHELQRTSAWLAAAVDLVLLSEETLSVLVEKRRPGAAATAFAHDDAVIEPLCTIWEPSGLELLARRAAAGDASPRRCLESADVEVLVCPDPSALRSFDSLSAYEEVRRAGLSSDRSE